jgi:hypothetical protein
MEYRYPYNHAENYNEVVMIIRGKLEKNQLPFCKYILVGKEICYLKLICCIRQVT